MASLSPKQEILKNDMDHLEEEITYIRKRVQFMS